MSEQPLGLVLAGGLSLRMGRDKAGLELEGETLQDRSARCLKPFTEFVYLSLRADQPRVAKGFDGTIVDQVEGIGPAAALLAAHAFAPDRDWLVLACDFPLVTPEALRMIVTAESSFAIAYQHEDGTPEPLMTLWRPPALAQLKSRLAQGSTGAVHVLRDGPTKLLTPLRAEWLTNTNSPEEWTAALRSRLDDKFR